MTESPSGGLPLGFLILSDQKQETLEAGFAELKQLLPQKAFAGRGVETGPELFMTDDDPVSIFFHFFANDFSDVTLVCGDSQ